MRFRMYVVAPGFQVPIFWVFSSVYVFEIAENYIFRLVDKATLRIRI